MDWKKQFKVHDLSFRDTCIILLVITVNLVILMFLLPSPPKRNVSRCNSHQRWIYRIMSEVPDGEGVELPPDWTVADLIREAAGKDFQTHQPWPVESAAEMRHRLEKEYLCRSVHYERKFPYLRRQRVEVTSPYLVFPVPASVVFDESIQEPVPILMCRPGAHDGKYSSMVLYSDGTTKALTREEAEKLVAEQSPVPLEIDFEPPAEEEQTP